MNEDVRIDEKHEFRNSQMIIGLDGWVNAGKVSTFSVKYLINKLGAKKFGEILQGRFHDYAIQRPFVSIKEGLINSYIPPQSILYYWKGKRDPNLILLLGVEPYTDWPRYTDAVLKVAESMNVSRIYTIGGYLADVTLEDEALISSTTNNKDLIDELKKIGVVLTSYMGPTSIYSEIMWKCGTKGIDVISLWGAVPIYIEGIYPKAAYHILKKITCLAGVEIDLTDLKKKAESFRFSSERRVISQSEMRRLLGNLRGKRKEKKPTYIL
ncbi:TPA: PAC2 family protein [Candidatus Bathyarchaeota archaeon]|nr:PAC2 family protein [Candidatus Bathyarchaeota archaeon]